MITSDLRSYFDAELHTRPFMRLGRNLRVFHFAIHTGETDPVKDWRYFSQVVGKGFGVELPKTTTRFFIHEGDGFTLRFERHTEFISLGVFLPGGVDEAAPFDPDAPNSLPADIIKRAPGSVIAATWLEMISDDRVLSPEDISAMFGQDNFAAAHVSEKGARVFNSFKLDGHPFVKHGFNRILVQNPGLSTRQTGRLAQRLIELEIYRQFALLALPMVRDLEGQLSGLEHDIASIARTMANTDDDDAEEFQRELEQLVNIMTRIEQISAQTSYRLAATTAYKAIADRRIKELREDRIEGFQMLEEFLERRLSPAIRTCAAFQNRLDNLAQRAQRSNTLLRTRIEMRIQIQNNDLLRSMEIRARTQLQLQETVELLSVAAITYYLVSLLSYLLGGIAALAAVKTIILAISVPVVAIGLYGLVRLLRRRIARS